MSIWHCELVLPNGLKVKHLFYTDLLSKDLFHIDKICRIGAIVFLISASCTRTDLNLLGFSWSFVGHMRTPSTLGLLHCILSLETFNSSFYLVLGGWGYLENIFFGGVWFPLVLNCRLRPFDLVFIKFECVECWSRLPIWSSLPSVVFCVKIAWIKCSIASEWRLCLL